VVILGLVLVKHQDLLLALQFLVGMIISTFFTLYVTPSMYLALAKNTKRIDAIDIELDKQLSKK
jgi:hypothetical protein